MGRQGAEHDRAGQRGLDAAVSREPPAPAKPLDGPPAWEPLQRLDEERWRAGKPNAPDTAEPSHEVAALLGRTVRT